jgi:outer membrane protein OmpA-like peptidoglycan-associated protein
MNATMLQPTEAKLVVLPVGGVLQRKCACGRLAKGPDAECESCKQHHALGLQRQLSIGASDDPLEREAEQTAKRLPDATASAPQTGASSRPIQRASAMTATPVQAPASVASTLASAGEALAPAARHFFEPRFGHDFSQVRVHHDAKAAASASDIGAEAYTLGGHIVFASDRYAPASTAGRHLLAHELAHVVQQGRSTPQTVRRHTLENDPATAPAMSCPIATDSAGESLLTMNFPSGGSQLDQTDKAILAGFATEWNLSPLQPVVRLDGYASIEGGPDTNWPLSCARVMAVASELNTPSVGGKPGIPSTSLEFFANGETERFGSALPDNRVVTLHAPGVARPTSREPSVHNWSVRNSGAVSSDNCAPLAHGSLGVDSEPGKLSNGIELAPHLRDHDPAYRYDIKRTKEAKYHRKPAWPFGMSGPWETVSAWNKPAGSDDDSHDSDECLIPITSGSLHKIYSEDRPGFRSMTTSKYNALVQKINFVEFVRIQRADGSTYDAPRQQLWHTVLMLERNSGSWSVTRASSEIDTGHLSSLDP